MAGKGSKPRSCFSKKFKENFDQINWTTEQTKHYEEKKGKKIYRYSR